MSPPPATVVLSKSKETPVSSPSSVAPVVVDSKMLLISVVADKTTKSSSSSATVVMEVDLSVTSGAIENPTSSSVFSDVMFSPAGGGVVILIRFGSIETANSSSRSSVEASGTVECSFGSSVGKIIPPPSVSSLSSSTGLETVSSVTTVSLSDSTVIPTSTTKSTEVVDSLVVVSVGAAVNMFGIVIPRKLVEREGTFVWSTSVTSSSSKSKSIPNSSGGSVVLNGMKSLSVVLGVANGSTTIGLIVLLGKTISSSFSSSKSIVSPSSSSSKSKLIPNSSGGSVVLNGIKSLSVVLGVANGSSTIGLIVLLGKTTDGVVSSIGSRVVPCSVEVFVVVFVVI